MIEVVDGWWRLQAGSHLTDTVVPDYWVLCRPA